MAGNVVEYNIGDWVFVDGYGNGFITKIEYLEYEEEGYAEIEFTVHLKGNNGWEDYYADLDDISPCYVEIDRELLLDVALLLKDYDWCKELAK